MTVARKPRIRRDSLPQRLVALALLGPCVARYGMASPAVQRYTISLDAGLSTMTVEARYASPVFGVRARSGSAGRYLAAASDCDTNRVIRLRNRRMLLPDSGIDCLHYTVDFAGAARHDNRYRDIEAANAIVSPSLWLWRPALDRNTVIDATFVLPLGVDVSVPWTAIDPAAGRYRLGRSPESANAVAVFGDFDRRRVQVPGATLRVAVPRTSLAVDIDAIARWLGDTAAGVALAYGRYPNPSPQVVVIPQRRSPADSAVPFGRVIRDGGEAIQLFVNASRPVSDYASDWTATHEFSHLLLPYLDRRHRWVSEGFAQYYQNVLLARAGVYDDRYAWQKIYDGLERGRRSRPDLSPNEAAEAGEQAALMKVYWSGAAIALMADVRLRELPGGWSLDRALEALQRCCLPADRVWSATDLFAQLDGLVGEPLFMPLYRRYSNTVGFPDTGPVFERLGLVVDAGRVSFRGEDGQAGVRADIMRGPVYPATRRLDPVD